MSGHDFRFQFHLSFRRKQIELLEQNLTSTEQRLRAENKSLEEFYVNKMTLLETDKDTALKKFEEKLTELVESQERTLAKMRESHLEEIEALKNDHRSSIANIRESRMLEFSAVQENGSYLSTLRNASTFLETASDNLQTIRVDMEAKIDRIHHERETHLEVRERRLEGELH